MLILSGHHTRVHSLAFAPDGRIMASGDFGGSVLLSDPAGLKPMLTLAGHAEPINAVAFAPDSGPMHIAAAVGCPVVSIWGATAAERSSPWGFADLAIKAEIPCYGCYLRQCPIDRECMRRISPAQIAATVRRALHARCAIRAQESSAS